VEKSFCIANGDLLKIDDLRTAPIFMLNDYVFDDLRLYNTKTLCLGMHVKRIQEAIELKHKKLPQKFTTEILDRRIRSLLNVNKVYKGGICRLLVYWQLFPEQSEPQFCIFTEPLESLEYEFPTQGVMLEMNHLDTEISNIPRFVAYKPLTDKATCDFYKNGRLYSTENQDILLLRNEKIFVVENTLPFTSYFVEHLIRKKWEITRVPYFTQDDFYNCTEILLCNQFIGIQWVRRIYHSAEPQNFKSFGTTHTRKIWGELASAIEEM